MPMTFDTQQLGSWFRQGIAILGLVFAALTQADSSMKLPVGVSVMLGALGPVIFGIEHFVSDPSTGSTPPVVVQPTPVQPGTPYNPPVPPVAKPGG